MIPAVVIETGAVPEFVSVTETVPELPTRGLPKAIVGGLAMSVPCVPVPLKGIDTV